MTWAICQKSIVVYDVTYDVTYDVIDDVIKVGTPNKNMFWKPIFKTQIYIFFTLHFVKNKKSYEQKSYVLRHRNCLFIAFVYANFEIKP